MEEFERDVARRAQTASGYTSRRARWDSSVRLRRIPILGLAVVALAVPLRLHDRASSLLSTTSVFIADAMRTASACVAGRRALAAERGDQNGLSKDLSSKDIGAELDLWRRPPVTLRAPAGTQPTHPGTMGGSERRLGRDKALKQMYRDRAFPAARIPDGAYQRALKHIRKMLPATPPAGSTSAGPQSWLLGLPSPLASLGSLFSPSGALAQGASYSWVEIGPAPFFLPDGTKNAGINGPLVVDPSSPVSGNPASSTRLYLGTFGGGIFRTEDGGATWDPLSDDAPSLQVASIAIHPGDAQQGRPDIVLWGTGLDASLVDPGAPQKSVGILRAVDTTITVNWLQIGPTWCIDPASPDPACQTGQAACMAGGTCVRSDPALCSCTDPANSALAAGEILVDTSGIGGVPVRVWAATSKGLWYSDNAADSAVSPDQVVWQRVTSLDTVSEPEPQVNRIFQSLVNNQVLYASVVKSPTFGVNGWYRSPDHGGTWQKLPIPVGGVSDLGEGQWVTRASIGVMLGVCSGGPNNGQPCSGDADCSGGTCTGVEDVIFSLITSIPSDPLCGVNSKVTRLFRTLDSGASWDLVTATSACTTEADCCDDLDCNCINGMCDPMPDCVGLRSVAVDPVDTNVVVLGGTQLWRSLSGAANGSFKQLARQILHDDHNALTFDPANHDVLFDGNDGGVWRTDDITAPTPTWTNVNGNLANIEFHRGALDILNYGVSYGGTQDNGSLKGTAPLEWWRLFGVGDDSTVIVDPTNSNVAYIVPLAGYTIVRTDDGGGSATSITNGLPLNVQYDSLATDPNDSSTLVVYSKADPDPSVGGRRVYRTTNADSTAAWFSITNQTGFQTNGIPETLPEIRTLAISHSDPNLIFAGSCGYQVWRTTDASSWTQLGQGQLPARCLSRLVIDSSVPCTASNCTLYAAVHGFNENDAIPGHVFRSTNGGQSWTDISGPPCSGAPCTSLPDVPMLDLTIHPTDPNAIYVASDMGIYQGTLSGSSWSWGTFVEGFPWTAMVKSIAVHRDAFLLRAWTFGRSAWEAELPGNPSPDLKVNTVDPTTSVPESPRVGDADSGQLYCVVWRDDRKAANDWHVYYRAYGFDAQNEPSPLAAEVRVDDTTTHVVGRPAVAGDPQATVAPFCSLVTWHDDRLSPGVNDHIYFQQVCSDGSRGFSGDVRGDTHETAINATNPVVTYQTAGDFAIAWESDRSAGSSVHDIQIRFFDSAGAPKPDQCGVVGCGDPGNEQCKVNTSTLDAMSPSVASDSAGNVFVAWHECDPDCDIPSAEGSIMVSKYNALGDLVDGPVRIDSSVANTVRRDPALAIDDSGNVIAVWWEGFSNGPETVFREILSNGLTTILQPEQVDQPPAMPPGADRAVFPGVAVGLDGTVAVAWEANVNAPDSSAVSPFAHSFDAAGVGRKNDFRVDRHGRSRAGPPRIARAPSLCEGGSSAGATCLSDVDCPGGTCTSKRFAYAWRDDRSGHFDVYTRAMNSVD